MSFMTKEDWKQKFDNYDKDKNGLISVGEIGHLLRYLGFNPTKQEEEEHMKQLDKNDDKGLDFEEVYAFIQGLDDPSGELMDAFRLHDKNGDGFIDEAELKAIFTSGNFSPDDIDGLFKLVDVNNDGKIEYKEFVELFSQSA